MVVEIRDWCQNVGEYNTYNFCIWHFGLCVIVSKIDRCRSSDPPYEIAINPIFRSYRVSDVIIHPDEIVGIDCVPTHLVARRARSAISDCLVCIVFYCIWSYVISATMLYRLLSEYIIHYHYITITRQSEMADLARRATRWVGHCQTGMCMSNFMMIGWEMAEILHIEISWKHVSVTYDLDLWPKILKIFVSHRVPILNVYVKFHDDRLRNDWDITLWNFAKTRTNTHTNKQTDMGITIPRPPPMGGEVTNKQTWALQYLALPLWGAR